MFHADAEPAAHWMANYHSAHDYSSQETEMELSLQLV
jgi:hypothetical protein